ncbi:PASTA domain-containing protein [bacterium]|nr:PASTA domain-containing protein [bacterium]MBU1074047.1 PASTA domain-containing protein [bacterium]MBU1674936.1 PASTA domain-containing protein [bacterium]
MKVWQFILLLVSLAAVFAVGLVLSNALLVPRLVHNNAEVRVPDLTGRATADAGRAAAQAGLAVEIVREETHPTLSAGIVISQLPESGHTVREGRSVALVVSAGPPAGQVPQLSGLSRQQAENTLQRESYRVGRILHMKRDGWVAATVAMNFPPVGTRTRKGGEVDLVIAEPPPTPAYLMPDLRGQALYAAQQAIEGAGCVIAPVRFERDRDVPHGTVLAQNPVPGTRIIKGETIELVASTR